MRRTIIEIKKIDNGWLLSVEGNETIVSAPQEMYFETLPKVLEYLKVNAHAVE